jgi:fermentation-respiration switch protein FrsA (DUF1100 family)
VPARTAGDRIVWTADAGGARRLLVATAADLAAGTAEPATPATLQVREILGVDGDTVLFAASEAEPTEIAVWAYGEGHLEQVSDGPGVSTGQRAGGTTVITTRNLESAEPTVRVLRGPRAEAGSGTPGERKVARLAVVRRPDVFHAAVSGAPVTDWRMYDTHATERYLGHPDTDGDHYDASSVLDDACELSRPLLLIHGLADDNVAIAHTLRLSSVLLAAGRPHSALPLSGITHMPVDEQVAENMLLLQLDFLRRALGVPAAGSAR